MDDDLGHEMKASDSGMIGDVERMVDHWRRRLGVSLTPDDR